MEAEFEALALCARRTLDPASADRLRELTAQGLDWEEIARLGRRHGLLPLLARHLGAAVPDALPPAVRESLRETAAEIARKNLGLLAALFRALDRLAEARIAAVPLKGPTLALALYGDLALREFVDLDVLVDAGEVLRARDALAQLGYGPLDWIPQEAEASVLRTGNAIALVRPEAGLFLEVHWRFFPRHFRFPLETTGPLGRLETIDVQGRRLPQLAPEDQLVFLAAHGFRHAWERLEWLCGVGELIRGRPEMDWDAAVGRARVLGGERMLGVALHLAARELAAPVPAPTLASTSDLAVADLVERVRRRWRSGRVAPLSRGEETRFRLRGRERRRDRLQYLVQVATTPSQADWRVARLKGPLSPLYYGIRILRLGAKYAARAARRGWPGG